MTKEDIINKIEEIYNSKNKEGKSTGKNFITHIIRAYTPVGKIQKIWDSSSKNLKCAITGHGVCTIEDAFQALHSEGMDKKMIEHLKAWGRGEAGIAESPFVKQLEGKVIGYTGQKTDTVMCLDAVEAFIAWLQHKILIGDKHISWVVGDMRKKEFIKVVREKLPAQEDQQRIDILEKASKHPKRATMSLGDMSALQELQQKLKNQEKNE